MLPEGARATPQGLVNVATGVTRPVTGRTRTSRRRPNSTTSSEPSGATSTPVGWSKITGGAGRTRIEPRREREPPATAASFHVPVSGNTRLAR